MKKTTAKLVSVDKRDDQPETNLFQMPFGLLEELHELQAVSWAIRQLTIHSDNPDGHISIQDFIARIGSLGSTIRAVQRSLHREREQVVYASEC